MGEPLVFNLAVPDNFLSLPLSEKVRIMEQSIREDVSWSGKIGDVAIQKGFHTDYLRYLEEFLEHPALRWSEASILSRKTRDLEGVLFDALCESQDSRSHGAEMCREAATMLEPLFAHLSELELSENIEMALS